MISEERLYTLAEQQIRQMQRLSRTQALRKLQTMGPELLEAITAILFERQGYETFAAQASAFEGVDVVATKEGWTVAVQCWRSTHDVGLPAVRGLYGAMLRSQADEAYLVTIAHISEQARVWAADKYIHLIDGPTLVDWIKHSSMASPGLFAGVRVPYVLLGALAALAFTVLVLAVIVAYPQISERLGISLRPTAAWVPPTVSNPQVAAYTPTAPLPTPGAPETVAVAASATPTAEPSPLPKPSPTPEATVSPECAIDAGSGLYDLYNSELLGCATTPVNTVWAAWQPFEGGYLLWRSDTDASYAFYGSSGGSWFEVLDRWDGSTLPDRGNPPAGRQAPIRGFGYVWSMSDDLFQNLGWAIDQEKGFCATVQEFEKGFLLRSSTVESCTPDGLFNHARTAAWTPLSLTAHAGGWSNADPGE